MGPQMNFLLFRTDAEMDEYLRSVPMKIGGSKRAPARAEFHNFGSALCPARLRVTGWNLHPHATAGPLTGMFGHQLRLFFETAAIFKWASCFIHSVAL